MRCLRDVGAEGAHLPSPTVVEVAQARTAQLGVLDTRHQALLDYVIGLTLWPRGMRRQHTRALRAATWTDRQIHDIAQVVSCFSFMNRLADGTGVVAEERKWPWAKTLFGQDALQTHLDWAIGDRPDDT